MSSAFRKKIAAFIAPEYEQEVAKALYDMDRKVNQRVADVLTKIDLFEPLLKKYNVIFSDEYEKPEDRLSEQSQTALFMWAAGVESDPSFKYLVDFIRNTQGNATLRKAKTDAEWFYGRAAVATITLFIGEVSRLASRYKDILAEKGHPFDEHLPVE